MLLDQLKLLLSNEFLQRTLVLKITKRQYGNYNLPIDRSKLPCINRCRVGVVGVGGVGSSLAHLLKTNPGLITELRLLNRSDPSGLLEELSHLPTPLPVCGYRCAENFREGLEDLDIVVIATGKLRKKDVPRETLFQENAQICVQIIKDCAKSCPNAMFTIITNPLDRIVPAMAEVLRRYPKRTYVPVIDGNEEDTIVPLFSRCRPNVDALPAEAAKLTEAVRCAECKVWQMKGTCTTFAMASAAMYFVHKLARAIRHEPNIVVSAYVVSCITNACFFSNELLLGADGVERNLGFGRISDYEQCLLDEVIPLLQERIKCSMQYACNF